MCCLPPRAGRVSWGRLKIGAIEGHFLDTGFQVQRGVMALCWWEGGVSPIHSQGCSPWAGGWNCACESHLLFIFLGFSYKCKTFHLGWYEVFHAEWNNSFCCFTKINNIPERSKPNLFFHLIFQFCCQTEKSAVLQTNNTELCSPIWNSGALMPNRRIFPGSIVCCKS